MSEKSTNLTLFEKKYKESLIEKNPCYAGVCWALERIESLSKSKSLTESEKQELQDAKAVFLDLYALALKELGEEAVSRFCDSIRYSENRKSFYGRRGVSDPYFREKGFFCKLEIQRIEKFKKKACTLERF